MLITVTIENAQDQADLHHLLVCDEHRPEFVGRLWHLLHRAIHVPPPDTVSLTITALDEGHDDLTGETVP